ncbi:MAG TPA: toxin TcdB middle/N-terminal domain-containing protein [Bryobacteraceae bacterium]|jgi:RHS repeat-associated protein
MSEDSNFDAQAPSLPEGGGAVSGLGETFSPDPATGTGSYAIPLDLPNGPDSIGPRLNLRYDTGGGNGPFGMGFSLSLLRMLRSLTSGFPRYDASDTLVLEGVGDLVATGGGNFRPAIETATWRVQPSGDGFQITDKQGLFYFLGISAAARLSDPVTGRVFAWHLERIDDALGNTAKFTWRNDGNQLYLDTIAYGVYEIQLQYENRPDIIRFGRAGFPIATNLRCNAIELRIPTDPQPLLRRWSLTYTQDDANGCSLLTEVTLTGFDANNAQIVAPVLQLGYSSFQTRDLTRFLNQDDGAPPSPLNRVDRRVELLDWNGDGLPDLLEIGGGGQARLWPNLGDCTWGRPRSVGSLPQFATPTAALAFVDMDGDGCADLVRVDQPISGYQPRLPAGGFGRPVSFPRAPSVLAGASNARLVDLDGDGILDLLSSSRDNLTLYFRIDPGGWSDVPVVVPRRTKAPDVDLDDPHVFTADMTGDGMDDVVRVDGAGVTYWQNLGGGRWADPVVMNHPPTLPFDTQPDRLFLSDIDGDGCADLIYLDQGRVLYWLNQTGNAFSDAHTVDYVPTGQISEARLADMRGSGTAGLLWSTPGPFGRGTSYFYLDFTADSKPHLLNRIDNGTGLTTQIGYSTSARQAAADTAAGDPWSTFLPIAVSVVVSTTAIDGATGRTGVVNYRYHEGRYDGVLREFCGFGRVDEEKIGDQTAPTLRTTTRYHIGLDLNAMTEPRTMEDRLRLRAIRGRTYRQERYGLDGSAQERLPYDVLDQDWTVVATPTAGGTIYSPRMLTSRRSNFERTAAAASTVTTASNAWDANGNVTDSTQTGEMAGDPAHTIAVRTLTQFANDPAGRFLSSVWRVQQQDASGAIISDTITQYDGAADGAIGAQGLVTRISRLILTDALATEVYGAAPPDFAALGYFRRPAETGWWAVHASYRRYDDAAGLHAQIIGPTGAVTTFDFDARRTYPAQVTDPRGNVIAAEHDYRTCRLNHLVDASGAESFAVFDALGRQTAAIKPGDTAALPTLTHTFVTSNLPNEAVHNQRAISGGAVTIESREFYDGTGELLEQRNLDETGEIVAASRVFSARGLLAKMYVEHRPASGADAVPSDTLAHIEYNYDALGRLIRQQRADGSYRLLTVGPLLIVDADEEDTRTGASATHSGTPTLRRLNALGQILRVEQNLSGVPKVSSYEYDSKGNITSHTDAAGNVVRIWYDLLSQIIRSDRPERSTLVILDASKNVAEVRNGDGTAVLRTFDECNRLTSVRFGAELPPVIQYTYHDSGFPPPPDAGAHTSGGRRVRIDDEGGTTIYDYDPRGKMAFKRYKVKGGATGYDLNFVYRSDGQLASITYPDGGAGRRTVAYEYNVRGSVSSVPGVIDAIEYDLARHRTRLLHANGVEQLMAYDPLTSRLSEMRLNGPAGLLRQQNYTYDEVGNVVGIGSPDPKLQANYTYDDLYRLTAAECGDGLNWTYRYDDAGNLTFKSDVGTYRYGEGGAPPTCLTSAGAQAFTYTPKGEMRTAPWGTQTFDPLGRLLSIVGPDGASGVNFTYDYAGARVAERTSGGALPAVDRITPDSLYSIEGGILTLHLFDSQGVVAWQATGGAALYLHPDHQGGLVAVTDGAGALLETIRYDPYGKILDRTPAEPPLPLTFGGGMLNDWSGLIYLLSRYYHPGLGRFVSPDIVVGDVNIPIAWNSYVYCGDNPVTYVDPAGTWFFAAFLVGFVVGLVYGLADGKSLGDSLGIAFETALTTGFGALLGGATFGYFGFLMGGLNGLFTGTRQIYDWSSIWGWAAFLSDSTWGIIGTSLGNFANVYDLIAAPSSYRSDLSRRQNRQVYDHGLYLDKNDADTFGNVTSNLSGGGGANILKHESTHILQNRIFGPAYIAVSVAWYVVGGAVGAVVGALIAGDPWVVVGFIVAGPAGAIVAGLLDSHGRQGARDVAYLDNPWELWAYSVQGTRNSGSGPLAF